jgi:hypothetical protein
VESVKKRFSSSATEEIKSCAFFPDWDGSEPNLISTVDNYNPGNSASENVKTQVITGQTLPY